mmetsp:Transcript_10461/g.20770  ORF Transcript_10461/g.20770 Transcript_10461/m.20770 type:complete len:231 (+) Transcript_10461:365-1057(+)
MSTPLLPRTFCRPLIAQTLVSPELLFLCLGKISAVGKTAFHDVVASTASLLSARSEKKNEAASSSETSTCRSRISKMMQAPVSVLDSQLEEAAILRFSMDGGSPGAALADTSCHTSWWSGTWRTSLTSLQQAGRMAVMAPPYKLTSLIFALTSSSVPKPDKTEAPPPPSSFVREGATCLLMDFSPSCRLLLKSGGVLRCSSSRVVITVASETFKITPEAFVAAADSIITG